VLSAYVGGQNLGGNWCKRCKRKVLIKGVVYLYVIVNRRQFPDGSVARMYSALEMLLVECVAGSVIRTLGRKTREQTFLTTFIPSCNGDTARNFLEIVGTKVGL
jgi:hypothetical protein